MTQPVFRPAYAGIGSRETPDDVLDLMSEVAAVLAHQGYILRSGGAPGADQAFLAGAISVHTHRYQAVETYLPWESFEREALNAIAGGSRSHIARTDPAKWTIPIAKMHHPRFASLTQGAMKLQARNVHQVLGSLEYLRDGKIVFDRSKFVLCWTKDGGPTGGTGQAIRIAQAYGVEVRNLHDSATRERVEAFLMSAYADKED
jgi:hypothetical protein